MDNIFFDISKLKHLGKNVILGKTVRIRKPEEVTIGDECIIDDFTYISCGMDLGNNSHIASNVSISGGAAGKKFIMGSYSTISNGTSVHCASSDYRKCSLELPTIPLKEQTGGIQADIVIGDYVTIGAHSCILPGVIIPEGVAFGAYTLIKPKKFLPYHLYVGTDCRDLGIREDIDVIKKHKERKN
jgi:acetyltransferase-like isoleucine patch superfamily enzyme